MKRTVPKPIPRLIIEEPGPAVDCGKFPVKRIVGEEFSAEVTAFRDGHAPLDVFLKWRRQGAKSSHTVPMTLINPGRDLWKGSFPLEELGSYIFSFEGRTEGSATVRSPTFTVIAEPSLTRFGAWYEMFVRSHGNFAGAQSRLEDIRAMGFDVIYLAPIHPVGKTKRKGKDNALEAGPDDPGSPWAIGNEDGGHDAIDPALGDWDDFERFVKATNGHGMEVALDFAVQCSPDHPWVRGHPEWFTYRTDGTIQYAENPPKKYEDVYPLDFDRGHENGLWEEMRRILLFWIDKGIKIFRVDNPHTKPVAFWSWLIEEIRNRHPEVFFLSEAFTRPPMMKRLAKIGFSQSYTYFTWRNTKSEIRDYLTELTQTPMREYFRPNFFINTPDILPKILVDGGRPAFLMRLVLAATLSPAYGIYSGYELCENEWIPHHAIPGEVEYAHSEKYESRSRDWNAPGNIKDVIAMVNRIRSENPALQLFTNLRFLETDNEQILFYAKATSDFSNVILVAVNLDPHHPHHATGWVPPDAVGLPPGSRFQVRDLLTGETYTWGERNYIRLDPNRLPAHILQVVP